ncbi:MAG: FosX/FosE/FosI family fosfomycin resistance hydrolase [Clostridia bacterium]|nr:FosX/FosE/FosI family fosfomycin resistance hydrolase [Clostridia bacterium]
MIEGISHITLMVRDLDRTAKFLEAVFDAEEIYSSGDKTFSTAREKYFLIGGIWIAIMKSDCAPERTYDHIAFKIEEDDFEKYASKAIAAGADIRPGRKRVDGEGRSLYFYDYDHHLFELHTGTLSERLDRYQ